jgi:hypothetical protein
MKFGPLFGIKNINEDQIFFLLTRDSLDKHSVIRGTLNYSRRSYEDGDSTGYLTLEPDDRIADWTCRVYLRDSTKGVKIFVMKDFFEHKILHFQFQMEYSVKRIKLNSRGLPFRFEKKIYLQK